MGQILVNESARGQRLPGIIAARNADMRPLEGLPNASAKNTQRILQCIRSIELRLVDGIQEKPAFLF